MTIKTQIVALTTATVLAVALVLGGITAHLSTRLSDRSVAELESTLRADYDASIRREVETVVSLLAAVEARVQKHELEPAQGMKLAADLVRALRYGKDDYFWIDTYEGVNVVLLGREIEGHGRLDLTDKHGFHMVRKMIEVARAGGGFTDYWFPRGSGGEPLPKRSYSAAYEPFGWVVGTGNYVDDIDATIAKQKAAVIAQRRAAVLEVGIAAVVLVVLAGAAAAFLARSLTRPIATLAAEARRIEAEVSAGRLDARGDEARVSAEFRAIVRGTNAILEAYARPLAVTVAHVTRLGRGDMPPPLQEGFAGDFRRIEESLNGAVEAVNALVSDSRALAEAAVGGRLSTRIDPARHQGEFRRVVEGVNATLDAVLAPVAEATVALEALAARDLRARVEGTFRGDHARLQRAVNAASDALHRAVAQVADAAEQVSTASRQIASTSQAVASGATEAASALQETGASLETVLSVTRRATEHAERANALASGARAKAREGNQALEGMQGAMQRVKRSAEGTSQIIKDVSEIAFQTNLLALNAAVEAARAGEAGRGFAVVAEEVRSLAQRAKDAAGRTEALIGESVREASEGELTARATAEKLGQVVAAIGEVGDLVSTIATAVREGVAGLDGVNQAVADLDKVTQQDAASAEESSAAAGELDGRAAELAALVAEFQLERDAARVR